MPSSSCHLEWAMFLCWDLCITGPPWKIDSAQNTLFASIMLLTMWNCQHSSLVSSVLCWASKIVQSCVQKSNVLYTSIISHQICALSYLKTVLMAADAKMFKGNLWTVSDLMGAVSTDPFSWSRRQKQETSSQPGTHTSYIMQQIFLFGADRPRFASIPSFPLCFMLYNWEPSLYIVSPMPNCFSNLELFSKTSIHSPFLHAWDHEAQPFSQLLSRPPYL